MKNTLLSALLIAGFAPLLPGADAPAPAPAAASAPSPFKDQKEKNSYSIGMSLGNIWKNQELDVDVDMLRKGITDAQAGKALLNEQEAREVIMSMQREINARMQEKRKQLGEKNKTEGEAFLKANKEKAGVITLPSGLQYRIITEGAGALPKSNDMVTVNYRGKLLDGTEFDSSFSRGQPATFAVNRVIKGWTEGLQLMKTGSKWELFIPSALGYGEMGSGQKIAPNATLIFEVELASIKPPTPPPASQPVTSDIIKVPSADEMKKGAQIEVIKKDDPRVKDAK